MFSVPQHFNRNAPDVQAGEPAADSGLSLLRYLCQRLNVPNLARLDVLDFGCGSRFADSIINRDVPILSYTGIDLFKPMIDFLRENALDERLSFHHMDARNPMYNPHGAVMTPDTKLPIADRAFDVICMFSVITHQLPDDAFSIFSILRRYVRPDGSMFFSACMEDGDFDYKEHIPEQPAGLSIYSWKLMRDLLARSGWQIVSIAPRNDCDMPILDSVLCIPT